MRNEKQFNSKNLTGMLSYCEKLSKEECFISIGIVEDDITKRQKSSASFYCSQIAEELNEQGQTHEERLLNGKMVEYRYTQEIVRRKVWDRIQLKMYGHTSLRDLKKDDVTEIAMTIEHLLLTGYGIDLPFPSIENLIYKLQNLVEKADKTEKDLIDLQKFRIIIERNRTDLGLSVKNFCKKHGIVEGEYSDLIG